MVSAVLMKRGQYALFSALLFYIIANPITYSVVDSVVVTLFGHSVPKVSVNGCPTGFGLLLHSVVFFLVVLGLMYL